MLVDCRKAEENEDSDDEDKWEANEIITGLFLGGLSSALDCKALAERDVGLVLSLHDLEQRAPTCRWHKISIADRADADLLSHLHAAVDILANHLDNETSQLDPTAYSGTAALVHCVAGVSRSCAVVAAFLVREREHTLREAIEHIQQHRPGAMPNRGFWRQLVAFEVGCLGEASFTQEQLPGAIIFEREALDRILAAHHSKSRGHQSYRASRSAKRGRRPPGEVSSDGDASAAAKAAKMSEGVVAARAGKQSHCVDE
ncbi:hypothetical protein CYMTET_28767 [Cymbomonas tetramitiformis]|uniref:Protein-tyrosine-phosphatase n=1 Tax=Cymbomonas tetramitiformis TaxID=36881 RepID=A0AAE0FL53_9CHLO|nr:hypothetical protein CYMTET_29378 [Cymbomonas tetramitiformis]KAK3262374.1 hypothetical protein CYMTET_28767 [Cymbomonas tetramitiformis]|eukprot:gene3991-4960_t